MTSLSVTTPASPDQIQTPQTSPMGGTSSTSSSSSSSSSSSAGSSSLQSLSPNDFINFLVTELQNQDPLNPTSSDQMLSQLSQIGQLESSTQLQTDLSGMVEQNQVSSASSMIGKQVTGTDANNLPQQGNVTAVQVQNNTVNLTLDSGAIVPMANVTTITNGTGASATTSGTTSTTPPS